MKPSFRKAGKPDSLTPVLTALLLSATALVGCATYKPPQISYDNDVPALPAASAPVDTRPKPLHVPPPWTPARGGRPGAAESKEAVGRVEMANDAARVEPRRDGYFNAVQIYPYSPGALYQVYAAPGQITDVALEPGEQLTGSGLYSTENRTTADGLQGLPRDYSGIPQLGPPLPGDLGRPILGAQNRGQPVPAPEAAIDAAEQRRQPEMEAARVSRLFASTGTRSANLGPTSMMEAGPSPQLGSLTAAGRQAEFLNGPVDRRTVSSERIAPPASPYVLQAGSVIAAALITGIRSDLPGQITAQVTENVYDSPTGQFVLVPQGTRLIGQYDNDVGFGQRRVLLVRSRLILPNGRSIVLERQPGADSEGYAGLEDGVDYHWWDLAKAAGLSTLLSVGAELAVDDEEQLISAIRDGAQDTINDAGQEIVRRQLNVAPTLTIRPGFPVRVIVTRDLVLEPYGG